MVLGHSLAVLLAALQLTFAFPLGPTPQPGGETGWKLYTWNPRFDHWDTSRGSLEFQTFYVTATKVNGKVTITLPEGVLPGTRAIALVPYWRLNDVEWEGQASVVHQMVIAP